MKALSIALLLLFSAVLTGVGVVAQPLHYTVGNAHSHNDYEQQTPFWLAYREGFGSIEADIFLVNGELLVAHETKELVLHRTLEDLYLNPLQSCMEKCSGRPYSDSTKQLQLLIDIKTDSIGTLARLIEVLQKYPILTGCPRLHIVITGNRPSPALYTSYPSFILFDGVLSQTYSREALSKVAMLSDYFHFYSTWNGQGELPAADRKRLQDAIDKGHQVHKAVRLWGAPDTMNAWGQFMGLHVDYINTDHIPDLSAYLRGQPREGSSDTGTMGKPQQ